MFARLATLVLASFILWPVLPASPVLAQAEAPGMDLAELPTFDQVTLTRESARNAVDSYLMLRETFGDQNFEDMTESEAGAAAQALAPEMKDILERYGFEDGERWSRTVQSVAFAYGALQENNLAEARQSLSELEADQSLPPELKTQMLAMLKSMIPSDNNVTVMRSVMSDPTYAGKLQQVFGDR